ncbi:MAG: putative porin [Gemmatimonadales bacterium]
MRRSLGLLAFLPAVLVGSGQAQSAPGVRFNGDFRLRYEYTTRGNGAPNIDKEVVRLRAGITYPLRGYLTVRARIATGSPGDPNSTDITLGQFVDDLAFSVDMASVELNRPRWGLLGGKFLNPLLSTELVWDGDVNPQGMAGRVTVGKPGNVTGTLTGLYFVVDQQANDTGSDMAGGQVALKAKPGARWQLTAAAGYYDYRIRSLALADAGDIRGNRLAPGGAAYLSDFDLLNAFLTVDYTGFGERFPLRVVGDYVHNAGANDLNTGWAADMYMGRVTRPGETRWRYGYAVAETDAILAAFAHDNTTLGTNSETHTLAVDAVPMAGMLLTGTWYIYRPHEVGAGVRRHYQTRLRLNAMVTF